VASESKEHSASSAPRPLSVRWWTGDQGLRGIAQWPNPAILVWFIALILKWADAPGDARSQASVAGVGLGALLVWALDELLRGTSPFRRSLGAMVLLAQAIRLFT